MIQYSKKNVGKITLSHCYNMSQTNFKLKDM